MDTKPQGYELDIQDDPSVLQDVSQLEGPLKSNLTAPGLSASFAESAESGFVYKGFEHVKDSVTDEVLPNNKTLTPEEAKEDPNYREGIDVSHGISQYMLKRSAEEYDRKQEQEFAISQMPDTVTSKVGRGVMSLIGVATDPATIALSAIAPETIGIRSAPFIAKAATTGGRFAKRAAIGMGEGLVIGSPSATADLMNENDYLPEQNKAQRAIADLAMFAGFNGAIRGLTGFKIPITEEAKQYANQVSAHQVAEGQFPNVDMIIQEGYYAARQLPDNESLQLLESNMEALTSKDIEPLINTDSLSELKNQLLGPLENGSIKNIKMPKAKSLFKQISTLREQRNGIMNEENINSLAAEIKNREPSINFKDARTKAVKQLKSERQPIDDQIKSFEQQVTDLKQFSQARSELRNFKRNMTGSNIKAAIEKAKQEVLQSPVAKNPSKTDVSRYHMMSTNVLNKELSNLDEGLTRLKSYLPSDLINDKSIKNVSQIISEVLSDFEKADNADQLSESSIKYSQMKLTQPVRQAIDILRSDPKNRTQEQNKQLLNTLFGDEEKQLKRDSRDMNKKLGQDISDAESMYYGNQLKNIASRLNDLTTAKAKYKNLWQVKQVFDASMIKKYDILRTLRQNEVYELMVRNTGRPVNKEDLASNVSDLMSPENGLSVDENEKRIFDSATAAISPTFSESFESVSRLFESLDERDTASIREEFGKLDTETRTITQALQQAAKCLGGVS